MKVGSLVELVEDFKMPLHHIEIIAGVELPVRNVTYTVREILKVGESIDIRLEEIVNPKVCYAEGFTECIFPMRKFRELQPPMDLSFIEEIQFEEVQTA